MKDFRTGGRILDQNSLESQKWADEYYEEIRHKSTDYIKIAERTGFDQATVKAIKDYIFSEGTWYNGVTGRKEAFAADPAIAQSWQRLCEGREILPHDMTLLKHEEYEMQIKREHPDISHDEAHSLANRKYNFQKESGEYYGDLRARSEKR